eukprot:8823530-Karenia_brevis.AAC.1
MCHLIGQLGGSHPLLEPVFILSVVWPVSVSAVRVPPPSVPVDVLVLPLPRFGPWLGGLFRSGGV